MKSVPTRPIAFIAHYIRQRSWSFGLLALIVIVAGSCAVAVHWSMKLIVDAMSTGDRQNAVIWVPLAMFLGLIAAESILWRSAGWLGCRNIVATGVDIRSDLFEHLLGHPMRYFSRNLSGALGGRITATAGATGAILSTLTWNILPPCIDFIGAIIVLTIIDPRMAAAMLIFVLIVAAIIMMFGIRGRDLHRAYGREAANVGGELVDTVTNAWTVKAFSASSRERERLHRAFSMEARTQRRSWMHLEKARVVHDACLLLMAGTMLVWALTSWQAGTLTAGDVVLISTLAFRILHGSRDLGFALVGTTQEFGVISEMLEAIAGKHALSDKPNAVATPPSTGHIVFSGVAYAHADGHTVLQDFNLEIPAGQKLGLVGPSGGGKSTLIGLLQRLDDVQAGEISIDGMSVTEYTQDSLRRAIAVVPQDVSLFRRTLMENIRYGRPDATDEEVERAADLAGCSDFIRRLPEGYDTVLGERGATLSGGQRQRIGIARAFLKDAPVLVLDEATSALDSHTEREVQAALARLMEHRTVIAVSHRLATLEHFDRIVVLDKGRVVQDDAPQILRNTDGLFRKLWKMQSLDPHSETPRPGFSGSNRLAGTEPQWRTS